MNPIPTLETERLVLRMFRPSDFDAYAAMCGDAEVMRYIGTGEPLTREDAWRNLALMIGHWELRGYGLWAAEEQATGQLIGRIGCWNPEGWPGLEVGWILRRTSWGKGLAIEGARAAVRYAFTELRQTRVLSLIHPANAASIRVAERLGERLEGTVKVMGKTALMYAITRESSPSGTGR
jgi:RimJ/RimL family protein N-acetyltransferase